MAKIQMDTTVPNRQETTNYALGFAFSVILVGVLGETNIWEVPGTIAAAFTTLSTWLAWRFNLGSG